MSLPPVPYWTIDALASNLPGGWNLHPDCIRAYIAAGQLAIEVREVDGDQMPVVLAEEKQRFEAAAPQDEPLNKRRENTLLQIIGALAIAYSGGDSEMIEQPYSLAADLEKCAGANGAQWPCSDDTTADALRDGIDLLRARGLYRPKGMKEAA